MVWGVFAYNIRSPLVFSRGTMTVQRYVHNILKPHVLRFMQRLLGAFSQQDNTWSHTARVSQALILTFVALPDPQICLQSSITEIIRDG
ncbi:transposable element Tcb1 transposase [Trichonephila clavipes]|nr:transposable element Tcb1 transposase [Trichonephila clavipes]